MNYVREEARHIFASVGTTRGQGIIRVVVVVVFIVATFFLHFHLLELSNISI